jgi:Leu/Phe-tRNA-protein transferase
MSRLDPRLLLQGYASGIFPMADSRDADELFWVEPRTRAIIRSTAFTSRARSGECFDRTGSKSRAIAISRR